MLPGLGLLLAPDLALAHAGGGLGAVALSIVALIPISVIDVALFVISLRLHRDSHTTQTDQRRRSGRAIALFSAILNLGLPVIASLLLTLANREVGVITAMLCLPLPLLGLPSFLLGLRIARLNRDAPPAAPKPVANAEPKPPASRGKRIALTVVAVLLVLLSLFPCLVVGLALGGAIGEGETGAVVIAFGLMALLALSPAVVILRWVRRQRRLDPAPESPES